MMFEPLMDMLFRGTLIRIQVLVQTLKDGRAFYILEKLHGAGHLLADSTICTCLESISSKYRKRIMRHTRSLNRIRLKSQSIRRAHRRAKLQVDG